MVREEKIMDFFDNPNTIYFAKLRGEALIPRKERENAGYDIYACLEDDVLIIPPYKNGLVPTGIAWACSEQFYMQIEERSSTGVKGIKRNAGVIDSGYRGEIKVAIFNANDIPLIFSDIGENDVRRKYPDLDKFIFYSTSKAIAQGVIHRVEDMSVKEISLKALQEIPSVRGEGAFGSTNTIQQDMQNVKNAMKSLRERLNEKR